MIQGLVKKDWAYFQWGEHAEISFRTKSVVQLKSTGEHKAIHVQLRQSTASLEGLDIVDTRLPYRLNALIQSGPETELELEHYLLKGMDAEDQQYMLYAGHQALMLYRESQVIEQIQHLQQELAPIKQIVPLMAVLDPFIKTELKSNLALLVKLDNEYCFGYWHDGVLLEAFGQLTQEELPSLKSLYLPNKWKTERVMDFHELSYHGSGTFDAILIADGQKRSISELILLGQGLYPFAFFCPGSTSLKFLEKQYECYRLTMDFCKKVVISFGLISLMILIAFGALKFWQANAKEKYENQVNEQLELEQSQQMLLEQNQALITALKQRSQLAQQMFVFQKSLPANVKILRWTNTGHSVKIDGYCQDEIAVSKALGAVEKIMPGIRLTHQEKLSEKAASMRLQIKGPAVVFQWEKTQ